MSLHHTTFEYLKPTEQQLRHMDRLRKEFQIFAGMLEEELPDGPDKTYLMRKLREVAMWVNVTITRNADGSPRS